MTLSPDLAALLEPSLTPADDLGAPPVAGVSDPNDAPSNVVEEKAMVMLAVGIGVLFVAMLGYAIAMRGGRP